MDFSKSKLVFILGSKEYIIQGYDENILKNYLNGISKYGLLYLINRLCLNI